MLKKIANTMPSLRTTLKTDGFVCLLCAIALMLEAQPLAKLIASNAPVLFGLTLPNQLRILGVGVLFVGVAVYAIASQRTIAPVAVLDGNPAIVLAHGAPLVNAGDAARVRALVEPLV